MKTVSTYSIGNSAHGLPIKAFEFGSRDWPAVLCIGGVHGDEIEGVTLAWSLWDEFLRAYPYKLNLVLIPEMNPDGVLYKTRVNANQVDLNRNLPTEDWISQTLNPRYPPGPHAASEPETKAFLKLWEERPFQFVFSMHSWNPLINTNGPCEEEAKVLHQWLGSPIEPSMGYPTPGALGTFAGLEKKVGTITLEIQRGLKNDEVISKYKPAMLEALKSLDLRLNKTTASVR
jgi:protein MpaA